MAALQASQPNRAQAALFSETSVEPHGTMPHIRRQCGAGHMQVQKRAACEILESSRTSFDFANATVNDV